MTLLLPRNEAAINGDAKNSKNTDEIDDQQKSDDKSEKGPFKTGNDSISCFLGLGIMGSNSLIINNQIRRCGLGLISSDSNSYGRFLTR